MHAEIVYAADILDAVGANRCNASGVVFGVDTACEEACSGAQIDLSSLQSLVPASYQDQFQNLCNGASNRCCAARGDALCTKAAERVGLKGSCKSSCGTGEVDAMTLVSGLPGGTNPCVDGSTCCVPQGSSPEVKPLSGAGADSFTKLQKGTAATPAAVTAEAKAPSVPQYGLINPLGARSIPTLMADLIKWLSGLAGAFFTLYLLWGGLEWMTAGGDSKKTTAARNRILYSILGIGVIFTAYFMIEALITVTNISF